MVREAYRRVGVCVLGLRNVSGASVDYVRAYGAKVYNDNPPQCRFEQENEGERSRAHQTVR
jgi:hypothetical protein